MIVYQTIKLELNNSRLQIEAILPFQLKDENLNKTLAKAIFILQHQLVWPSKKFYKTVMQYSGLKVIKLTEKAGGHCSLAGSVLVY